MSCRGALLGILLLAGAARNTAITSDDEMCDVREHITNHISTECSMQMLDEFYMLDENEEPVYVYAPHTNTFAISQNQVDLFRWKHDGRIIDEYGARIGLPPTLTSKVQAFAQELKILDLLHHILYEDPCDNDRGRFYKQVYQRERETREDTNDSPNRDSSATNLLWAVQRPGNHFLSDIHWFAPADEWTHEVMLRLLFQGGFRETLQAIGDYFHLNTLTIQSVGFLAVSYAENEGMHIDFEDAGKAFNLLVPIVLPINNTEPEFKLIGFNETTENIHAAIKLEKNVGVLVGDKTWHGTRDCDHTPTRQMRVMLSVYLADLTRENVDVIAQDRTAIFPVQGEVNWLWAQQGRHWRKNSQSNEMDFGRRPFMAEDKWEECTELASDGDCISGEDPFETRLYCPESCQVYIPDYMYRPGIDRSIVIGDLISDE